MAISDEITRLQNAKSALKTAIEGKGVSVPASTKLDGYSALVDSIEQGGGGGGGTTAKPNDVEFIDYDGTIVASYSAAEFANLAALPDNPDHTSDGLVSQGWNWTLSNAKTYVASYGRLVIGQMYTTDDGATRITFDMSDWAKPWPITMQFTQSKANGVAVDWGDGSAVQRVSGTTDVKLNHTYATTGVYVISLLPDSGCTLTITGSGSGSYLFAQANDDRFKLSSVKSVHIGNSVAIGNNAFSSCYSLQSVTIPSGVTSIGNSAFNSCYSLQSVTIPSNVTSISDRAFISCYSLQSVTIPSNVTSIGANTFYICYSLQSVTIPSGVTSIGNSAFFNCYSLQSVTIPSNVTSISDRAFYSCYSLQSVTIPSSVTNIGTYVFNSCYSLQEMIFERTSPPTLSGASNSLGSTSFTFPIYVPDSAVSSYKSSYTDYASRIKGISERE